MARSDDETRQWCRRITLRQSRTRVDNEISPYLACVHSRWRARDRHARADHNFHVKRILIRGSGIFKRPAQHRDDVCAQFS